MEKSKPRIAIICGAGISAPSNLECYRGDNNPNALWNIHDFYELASKDSWVKNRTRVNEFYNYRRQQLQTVVPNEAHYAITKLQEHFHVDVITQNVDDLHERAKNVNILHMHGELTKIRDEVTQNEFYWGYESLYDDTLSPDNGPSRPAVIWFNEAVPNIPTAKELCKEADMIVVIGTSLNVTPCSNLVFGSPRDKIKIFNTEYNNFYSKEQQYIGSADETFPKFVDELIAQYS
jgi:NAD-dependent deacetylase